MFGALERRLFACYALVTVMGCSGNDNQSGASSDGGANSTNTDSARGGSGSSVNSGKGGSSSASTDSSSQTAQAPSWSELWTKYFEPECATCHKNASTVGKGKVFSNAAELCTILTNSKQLNGTSSPPLTSESQSLLLWFNSKSGTMPDGGGQTPANAVSDIKAWAAAGAKCP